MCIIIYIFSEEKSFSADIVALLLTISYVTKAFFSCFASYPYSFSPARCCEIRAKKHSNCSTFRAFIDFTFFSPSPFCWFFWRISQKRALDVRGKRILKVFSSQRAAQLEAQNKVVNLRFEIDSQFPGKYISKFMLE